MKPSRVSGAASIFQSSSFKEGPAEPGRSQISNLRSRQQKLRHTPMTICQSLEFTSNRKANDIRLLPTPKERGSSAGGLCTRPDLRLIEISNSKFEISISQPRYRAASLLHNGFRNRWLRVEQLADQLGTRRSSHQADDNSRHGRDPQTPDDGIIAQ